MQKNTKKNETLALYYENSKIEAKQHQKKEKNALILK